MVKFFLLVLVIVPQLALASNLRDQMTCSFEMARDGKVFFHKDTTLCANRSDELPLNLTQDTSSGAFKEQILFNHPSGPATLNLELSYQFFIRFAIGDYSRSAEVSNCTRTDLAIQGEKNYIIQIPCMQKDSVDTALNVEGFPLLKPEQYTGFIGISQGEDYLGTIEINCKDASTDRGSCGE